MRRILYVATGVGLLVGVLHCLPEPGVQYPFQQAKRQGAAPPRNNRVITVATWNLGRLDPARLDDPALSRILANVVRRYDVIALQQVQSAQSDLMARLAAQINALGEEYDYVVGPRLLGGPHPEQLAYLFDTRRVQTDRGWVYSASAETSSASGRNPLVSRFVTRGADPPFSFLLVNVRLDESRLAPELESLGQVLEQVRRDASFEDDVFVIGGVPTDLPEVARWASKLQVGPALTGLTSNRRETRLEQNLLIPFGAGHEFTGRSGIFCFDRELAVSLPEAQCLSDQRPMWAEFELQEAPSALASFPRTANQ